jgi:hypothetical protein
MLIRTCDHLKEDGACCDSTALHGRNFCYFHLNVHGRRMKMARALARGEACRLQLSVRDAVNEEVAGRLKNSSQLQTSQSVTNKWLWN